MKKVVSAALVALLSAASANAAVTVGIRATSGTDLNNIHVGDTFNLDVFLDGDAGESFLGGGGGSASISTNLDLLSSDFGSDYQADFSTQPTLYLLTLTALDAGPAAVSLSGIDVESATASYPSIDTPLFTFNIQSNVPEPATWAMFIGGFGLVGATMRRRQRTSVRFG